MAKRLRIARQRWEQLVSEQPTSGQSIAVFCRSKNVPQNSFYLWRRKLANERQPVQGGASFIPVEVVGAKHVAIDLPCGATLRVPSDESSMSLVLSVLLRLGGME
jgi:transposase-like protein